MGNQPKEAGRIPDCAGYRMFYDDIRLAIDVWETEGGLVLPLDQSRPEISGEPLLHHVASEPSQWLQTHPET